MKIALIQPNLDDKHRGQKQAYGSSARPPETGLAVLSSWVNAYSKKPHDIIVLNPDKDLADIAKEAAEYDLLGITDWFSNHGSCTSLAIKVKALNKQTTILLGGPNASILPAVILKNQVCIDYVVSRDGEDALLALAEQRPIEEVPNLWHRVEGGVRFTRQKYTSLRDMPLWDFSNFQDSEKRMLEYLSVQNSGLDPWLVPPLTLFAHRGCLKAAREGTCTYCSSAEEKMRNLPPEKLWDQVTNLDNLYGAKIFYMCDDIFPISARSIKQIAEAKPTEARARIRAYGYLPILAGLSQRELEQSSINMSEIGIFNLFFGSETYDAQVLSSVNKHSVSLEETSRIIRTLSDFGGIRTTIAFMLGLPGETRASLDTNLRSLNQLLALDSCIERLYISIAMPLRGTSWCKTLEGNKSLMQEYEMGTEKNLSDDDSPDYGLLTRLSVKYSTSVGVGDIREYLNRMTAAAKERMPDYRIGGFLLDF